MPSMKSDELGRCWNHSPGAQRARAAARRLGGRAKAEARRAVEAPEPARAPAAAQSVTPFDLGAVDSPKAILTATSRIAAGLASGALDRPRARLLMEVVAMAREQLEDALGEGAFTELGGRPPTDLELAYLVTYGRVPPGLQLVHQPLRVHGAPWLPQPGERGHELAVEPEPPAPEPDASV
jgi:hypothetical protein